MPQLQRDTLSEQVIGAAIEVHRHLGPGLLESSYEACLCFEMSRGGLAFERQVPLPIIFKGHRLVCGYRLDIVVEEQLILEIKCLDQLTRLHEAQMLTYLRLSGLRNGLLLNFNAVLLKHGLRRYAQTPSACSACSAVDLSGPTTPTTPPMTPHA